MNKMKAIENAVKEREKAVYEYIILFVQENGYAPTNKEISEALKIPSKATVYNTLLELQDKGKIDIGAGCARAIKINGYELIKKEYSNRTMLEDFLYKYPDAKTEEGAPVVCPFELGYEKDGNCINYSSCLECWSREVNDEIN